jgi:hypothetical protein
MTNSDDEEITRIVRVKAHIPGVAFFRVDFPFVCLKKDKLTIDYEFHAIRILKQINPALKFLNIVDVRDKEEMILLYQLLDPNDDE